MSAISLAALLVVAVGTSSNAGGQSRRSAATQRVASLPQPGPATSLGASSSTSGDLLSQYIVRFRTERGLNSTVLDELRAGTDLSDVWTQAIDGFAATLTAADLARLRSDPDVLSIQHDRWVNASVDQISPPWGLDRIDQPSLPLNGGYSYNSTGAGVTAYIVDSGINSTHTEFSGRIAQGAYIDFSTRIGALPGETASTEDCNGHGTHVAGIIGGSTYGVAKNVSLVPVKVFPCAGPATDSDVIAGLDFVLTDHAAHPGVPAVANLSLGGTMSTLLDQAVLNVITSGITVVVAAGNENADACAVSPAHVPEAITVAASDIGDHAATFTNHGTCVDLFAPGVNIVSAWIGGPDAAKVESGTSMAAPSVAGVVARMLELTPTATPAAIWFALDAASTKGALLAPLALGDPNKLLFEAPPTPAFLPKPPGTPRMFSVTPSNGSATLTWMRPFSDGSSAILSYAVSCAAPGQTTITNDPVLASPWTVIGLTNGVQYVCTVTASNALGTGPTSSAKSVTPRTTPDALTLPSASPASRRAILTWAPPAVDGGAPIKGYVITCSAGVTLRTKRAPALATTAIVSGLANGTEYSCNVAAKNVAGIGLASTSTQVTPRTVPSVPLTPVAVPGSASATITFAAPFSDGGSAITGYTATCVSTALGATSPVASSGSGSPLFVPGLTAGKRYTCKVLATNVAGNSRASSARSVTPTV